MAKLFIADRRSQGKNPHSRLGKMARILNSQFRAGNYCELCRVDVGGKDEAQQVLQMTGHLKKAHKDAYEKYLLEQNKVKRDAAEALS